MESDLETTRDLAAVLHLAASALLGSAKAMEALPDAELSDDRARRVLMGLAMLRADLERHLAKAEKLAGVEHVVVPTDATLDLSQEAANDPDYSPG